MLDHYMISSLVREIEEKLVSLRVQKIWSVNQSSFLLKFKSSAFLLIDLSPQKSHTRILKSKAQTQDLPQPFLIALRKTLEGAKLLGLGQVEKERTIYLEFQGRTPTYDSVVYRLYIEFMGRHSNSLITTEDDKILYAYKSTPFDAKTDHIVRKDWTFTPLKSDKKDPKNSMAPSSELLDYRGFYKGLIKLLPVSILEERVGQIDSWIEKSTDYRIFLDKNGEFKDFHKFNNSNHRSLVYPSPSEMLEVFYSSSPNKNKRIGRVRKILDNRLELIEDKIDKLKKGIADTEKADKFKLWGELLLANLHSLPNKLSEVELINYYEDKPITLVLDDKKSPLDNAKNFYKNYEKLNRARPALEKQLTLANSERFSLEQVLYNLNQVETSSDMEEIYQELEKLRLIQKSKRPSLAPSKARSFNYLGLHYEVGKNNRQNDEIRRRVKNSNFVWFHTKDLPGSHVILHENLEKASQEALNFGAMLASYYSKAQGEKVIVDYTRISRVSKPTGSRAGYVNYFDAKQIFIGARAEDILPFENK